MTHFYISDQNHESAFLTKKSLTKSVKDSYTSLTMKIAQMCE